MNASEFYSQAQRDPAFRQQRLEEARFQAKWAIGFGTASVAAWLGYCGIAERRWPGDVGIGFALVLCTSLHAQARARRGALEAMRPESSNPVAPPTSNPGRG